MAAAGGAVEHVNLKATLTGHGDWVTAVAAAPFVDGGSEQPPSFLTGSRDKTVIVWKIDEDDTDYAVPIRRLRGHSHFVQDLCYSGLGMHALTASWDSTMRLWDLKTGNSMTTFVGHTKDVLSVAFNHGNTKIMSGSRDKQMKLWNINGEVKMDVVDGGHTDWVSCVRFSPPNVERMGAATDELVSCGWDKKIKVWTLQENECFRRLEMSGHEAYVSTVTISPDAGVCASGGRDGLVIVWDLLEGKELYRIEPGCPVHQLVFSPTRFWLCAATEKDITIWDVEHNTVVANLVPEAEEADETEEGEATAESKKALKPYCTSLAWTHDGNTLISGYTDKKVRVWNVSSTTA